MCWVGRPAAAIFSWGLPVVPVDPSWVFPAMKCMPGCEPVWLSPPAKVVVVIVAVSLVEACPSRFTPETVSSAKLVIRQGRINKKSNLFDYDCFDETKYDARAAHAYLLLGVGSRAKDARIFAKSILKWLYGHQKSGLDRYGTASGTNLYAYYSSIYLFLFRAPAVRRFARSGLSGSGQLAWPASSNTPSGTNAIEPRLRQRFLARPGL
jgi:hypothetical protein